MLAPQVTEPHQDDRHALMRSEGLNCHSCFDNAYNAHQSPGETCTHLYAGSVHDGAQLATLLSSHSGRHASVLGQADIAPGQRDQRRRGLQSKVSRMDRI